MKISTVNKNIVLAALMVFSFTTLVSQSGEVLIWEDDFSENSINTSNWNVVKDNSGGGNDELQYYTPRDTNVYVEDGKLIIRALQEQYEGWEYTSGKLTTKGIADWRYGRVEAAIKMPAGKGLWPAFWMLPTENKYGGWPASGEIDIVELIGNDTNTVYGTLHYGPPRSYTNDQFSLENGYFSDASHVYAIEWQADTIKWFVDEHLYALKTADSLTNPEQWNIFRERFYLILNLAVGGNWPGDPDETTIFPQKMEVDYVRVYGNPAIQEIIAVDSAYANASGISYSFTNIPGAVFEWSVPGDATITSGQGTNSIIVNWGCNPGNIGLTVSGIEGGPYEYTLPVVFAKPNISAIDQVFPLDEISFAVPALTGTQYSWEYPEDAEEVYNTGDSLTLQWGCGEGYVIMTADNNCGTASDSIYVNILEPVISGPATVSEYSSNVIYRVDEVPESVYTWAVPEDASITAGQGTDSIKVEFGLIGGNLGVEISNVCYTRLLEIPLRITDSIILADYESTSPVFVDFFNTTFDIVENPAPDNVNPSAHVGESLKTEVAWAGIYTDLGFNLDLSTHKKFNMKVLGPKTGQVLLKLEDIDVGTVSPVEVLANYTNPNEWQNLEYIFDDAATDVYDRVTIFFDFGSEVANTYYFDDLMLLPSADPNNAVQFAEKQVEIYPNPASDRLFISQQNTNRFNISILDIHGRELVRKTVEGQKNILHIAHLDPGIYILSVMIEGSIQNELFIKK